MHCVMVQQISSHNIMDLVANMGLFNAYHLATLSTMNTTKKDVITLVVSNQVSREGGRLSERDRSSTTSLIITAKNRYFGYSKKVERELRDSLKDNNTNHGSLTRWNNKK